MMVFKNLYRTLFSIAVMFGLKKPFALSVTAPIAPSSSEKGESPAGTKPTPKRRDCRICGSSLERYYEGGHSVIRCSFCAYLEHREANRDAWDEDAARQVKVQVMQGAIANMRGDRAEQLVAEMLQKFKDEGFINGFRHNRKNSKDDRRAVDFRIYAPCEKGQLTIPLQVKSSWKHAILHNRKYNDYRNRRQPRIYKSKSKRRRIGGPKGHPVERIPCVVAYDAGCEHELRNIVMRYVFYYGVV
jgi:hypothetical protein